MLHESMSTAHGAAQIVPDDGTLLGWGRKKNCGQRGSGRSYWAWNQSKTRPQSTRRMHDSTTELYDQLGDTLYLRALSEIDLVANIGVPSEQQHYLPRLPESSPVPYRGQPS